MSYIPLKSRRRTKIASKIKGVTAARKRFSLTSTGIVMATQSGKRHGMRKQTKRQLNNNTGTVALSPSVSKLIFDRYLNH